MILIKSLFSFKVICFQLETCSFDCIIIKFKLPIPRVLEMCLWEWKMANISQKVLRKLPFNWIIEAFPCIEENLQQFELHHVKILFVFLFSFCGSRLVPSSAWVKFSSRSMKHKREFCLLVRFSFVLQLRQHGREDEKLANYLKNRIKSFSTEKRTLKVNCKVELNFLTNIKIRKIVEKHKIKLQWKLTTIFHGKNEKSVRKAL